MLREHTHQEEERDRGGTQIQGAGRDKHKEERRKEVVVEHIFF